MIEQKVGQAAWLSPEALSRYVDVPLQTVYGWNSKGTGPRRSRVGRHVRYRLADVDAWLESQADKPRPTAVSP